MSRLFGLLLVGLVLAGCQTSGLVGKNSGLNLGQYEHFRQLKFKIGKVKYDSFAAYTQGQDLFGFYANGILFYDVHVCKWKSRITNRTTKTGSFEVFCPNNLTVNGTYTYRGGRQGSFGSGVDSNGRKVTYNLGANGSSSLSEIDSHYALVMTQKNLGSSSGSIEQTGVSSSTRNSSSEDEQKIVRLEQQLAALKTQSESTQTSINNDIENPEITISSSGVVNKQGKITGQITDNVGLAELTIDDKVIQFNKAGYFEFQQYVPVSGLTVAIQVTDIAGLSSKKLVSLERSVDLQSASISFDRLNPLKRKAQSNKDAIALVVGIGKYENIIDAAFADKDALVFRDYATEKLGIPESSVRTLINEEADIGEVLLSIRKWIRRSTKPGKTDVYVFYAGHGIATASGEAYILPYDGRPEIDLLDRTALLQKELFAEIDKAKPRNVTIFLDACYTGKARTGEVLMADANYRPTAIRPIDDGMPDNFTLITASSGDEFSGPLEEAKHGMFSYFLMKGMEGDADSNRDNQITSGELHEYVRENVLRQSADKQTPELQGDADRVLVRFQ